MRDFLARYIAHNWALKVVALICSVLLWLAVSREPIVETAYNVPIELHHVPPNLEITTSGIPLAQVRLRGPERRIRQVTPADVHPVINLSGTRTGEHTYDLTSSQVHVPYDINVVQVTPSEVRIGFDRSLVRQIEIRPRITGRFESGFGVLSATANPATITVIGPQAHVDAVTTAVTDPIDVTGVQGTATFSTNAFVPDPLVREIRPQEVHVTVVTGSLAPEHIKGR